MTQTQVYCTINGNSYENWTLIGDLRGETPDYLVSSYYLEKLKGTPPLHTSIVPKKQSTIYVCPNCPEASMDISKNYTIKRTPDAGDYNVFVPIKYCFSRKTCFVFNTILIYNTEKTIVAFANKQTKDDAEALVKDKYNLKSTPEYKSVLFSSDLPVLKLYKCNDSGIYKDLFLENKTFSKPWVSYTQLDLSSDLPVTLDILRLVHSAGTARLGSPNSKENFLLQINVLNNYNWRAYPFTMQILRSVFQSHYYYVATTVRSDLSAYPKVIKNFFTQPLPKELTREDFQLAQEFVMDLYNLKGTSFIDFYKFQNKLLDDNILSLATTVLSTIVKVKPLTFEEYESKKQSNN